MSTRYNGIIGTLSANAVDVVVPLFLSKFPYLLYAISSFVSRCASVLTNIYYILVKSVLTFDARTFAVSLLRVSR